MDAFTDGVERTVDLGRVNDRVFVNNTSLGVYAEVVRSGAYRGAKLRTWGASCRICSARPRPHQI